MESADLPHSPILNRRSPCASWEIVVPQDAFADISDSDLRLLSHHVLDALRSRGLSSPPVPPNPRTPSVAVPAFAPVTVTPPVPTRPDIYDNARFEQIACAGLSQCYDMSPDQLIPTLNLIHLCRQNEVWYTATFLTAEGKVIDLVKDFPRITLESAKQQATQLWSMPNANILWHTRGTQLYNSRLFALFLFNSLTPEFAALLHSHLDTEYSMDGPLLCIAMCNHIHRNHLAFIESIKHKIHLSTLQDHGNDMPKYLRFLQDNLRIITSTGEADTSHNNLIPHIFMQLWNTTIPLFQQCILTWQRKYMENSLNVSPMKLVSMADEECQILKHFNQWVETIDLSIVAMKALVQGNMNGAHSLLEQLSAHLSSLTKDDKPTGYHGKQDADNTDNHFQGRGNDNPPWVYGTPTDKAQMCMFRGRTWYYCTKCGRDGN
jgi:hypothetical protein